MARIKCIVNYDPATKEAKVVDQVLEINQQDEVTFVTKTENLAVRFEGGYPPGKLAPGQIYKVPTLDLLATSQKVHFDCGLLVDGKFTPYGGGGDAPGGGPGKH